MADSNRSHLRIPEGSVWSVPFHQQPHVPRAYRDDIQEHANRLLGAYYDLFEAIRDCEDGRHLFLRVEAARDWPIQRERGNLEKLGMKLVSVSPNEGNIGIVKITRARFYGLERRLQGYAYTPRHRGKSYFAAIENIREVPASEKIDMGLLGRDEVRSDCLVSLYRSIPVPMQEQVARAIVSRMEPLGRAYLHIRSYLDGVVSIAAPLSRAEMEELSARYTSIHRIEPNDPLTTESSVPHIPLPPAIIVGEPQCREPVVVIDSGINPNAHLLSSIVSEKL